MNHFKITVTHLDGSVTKHFVDSYASKWFVLQSFMSHKPHQQYYSITVIKDEKLS